MPTIYPTRTRWVRGPSWQGLGQRRARLLLTKPSLQCFLLGSCSPRYMTLTFRSEYTTRRVGGGCSERP